MVNKVAILALCVLLGTASAANWAVLVAGSNGYYNYRHQADICHAYQALIKGGIPASNIIVFAYDDIANNPQNPIPGKLFNKPNGNDVYAGCAIDYKGADVTPKNFLNVLAQNSAAMAKIGTGRVLKSTSADKVFINFSDHGAPGLIAFPSQYLYATDLTPVLNAMFKNNQYNELTFYLEACESGSMFQGYPTNQKLYALTAANPNQSSWATYCPPQDNIGNVHIGTCLGDLFSVTWMEDIDAVNTGSETLNQQFQKVLTATASQQQACQYGDMTFQTEALANFVGNENPSKVNSENDEYALGSTVSSRDMKLMYLVNRHSRLLTAQSQFELQEEIMSRRLYDEVFFELAKATGKMTKAQDTDFECYKELIAELESGCGKTSDYGLKYFRNLYDICATPKINKTSVKYTIAAACKAFSAFQTVA